MLKYLEKAAIKSSQRREKRVLFGNLSTGGKTMGLDLVLEFVPDSVFSLNRLRSAKDSWNVWYDPK